MTLVAAALASPACILPPELSPAPADAGVSSPPVILSASPTPEFDFPGPITFNRQDPRTLTLQVLDNDEEDVIYVRLYVDYSADQPGPAYAECQAASNGERTRLVACAVNSVCTPIEQTDQELTHTLEAMVADREFIANGDPAAEGQPLFRALRDSSVASYSFRTWSFGCNPPQDL